MSSQRFKLPLSKAESRDVTDFQAKEMLYEYAIGTLDSSRQERVREKLQRDVKLQKEFSAITGGMRYLERLSEIEVAPQLIEEVNEPDTYLSVLLRKSRFESWPISVKWGMEALVVLGCISIFLSVIPWGDVLQAGLSMGQKHLTLAEISNEYKVGEGESLDAIEKKEPAEFPDEMVKSPKEEAVPIAASAGTTAAQKKSVDATSSTVSEAEKKAAEGFLYRGSISITNLKMTGPKITEQLLAFGARKAGEVELGWAKSPTTMYYHFTLPEAKMSELSQYLNKFGKLQMSKEKHPRIMKEGIVRIIISMDEAER